MYCWKQGNAREIVDMMPTYSLEESIGGVQSYQHEAAGTWQVFFEYTFACSMLSGWRNDFNSLKSVVGYIRSERQGTSESETKL